MNKSKKLKQFQNSNDKNNIKQFVIIVWKCLIKFFHFF